MINGISLFANVGIGETYFKEKDINICVSNELIEKDVVSILIYILNQK